MDQCIHGHDYTLENVYRGPNGKRQCRECRRRRTRERDAKRRRAMKILTSLGVKT